jgi:hypothetical protein
MAQDKHHAVSLIQEVASVVQDPNDFKEDFGTKNEVGPEDKPHISSDISDLDDLSALNIGDDAMDVDQPVGDAAANEENASSDYRYVLNAVLVYETLASL